MLNLFIVDYFDLHKRNGLATYVSHLSKHLRKNKQVKLSFIWINSKPESGFNVSKTENWQYYIPGEVGSVMGNETFSKKAAAFLATQLKKKKNVIFHFNWINHCAFGYLLKHEMECKTILTQHCTPWRELITLNYPLFKKLNERFEHDEQELELLHPVLLQEQWSYRAMDHIICVSEVGKKSLTRMLGFPSDKISIIYNGMHVSNRKKQQTSKELRKQYQIPETEKIILFAGSIAEKKGAFDLAEAFEVLVKFHLPKPLRLIMAGYGDLNKVLERVKKDSWLKITFTGHIGKEHLYDLYKLSDIGVVPSYVEPFGYTALEMMNFELPVVVTDVDGLREVVPENCGLKIPLVYGNAKASVKISKLVEGIGNLLANKTTAKRNAFHAKKHVLANFDARLMTSKTVTLYREVLNGTKSPQNIVDLKYPLVSVIVSRFSSKSAVENFLALNIQNQKYRNLEILVVGENDNMEFKKHDGYNLQQINVAKETDHSACLNLGIKLAKGKYIVIASEAIIFHPERFKKQVGFLEDPQNTDTALVGSFLFFVDKEKVPITLTQFPVRDLAIKSTMLFRNPISQDTVMFRAEILKKKKYLNHTYSLDGHDLWHRISKTHKLENLPEFLTHRIILEKDISSYKSTVANFVSDKLDELFDVTEDELATHLAILFGYMQNFFNTPEKIVFLRNWVNKVLKPLQEKYSISDTQSKILSSFILECYCGID